MDPDSPPPIPPHFQYKQDDMKDLASMRRSMSRMTHQARDYNDSDSPTGSPVDRYGRRQPMTTSPVKPNAGGKRRTKKKCGGKRHKKSKTTKKRGHKKSKTNKKRGSRKRA